ncbi:hypothetical protein C4D60_Mb03t20780 [Musa balbisiana]|uniref:Uncharacterized protein n=1 Tax=Musa balbisiana TaxID=52838 RepID=A0A4S8JCG0_MUSBA|nr:hypothetical protein C4D60_Mb03t20780 [Musa balbisiana]
MVATVVSSSCFTNPGSGSSASAAEDSLKRVECGGFTIQITYWSAPILAPTPDPLSSLPETDKTKPSFLLGWPPIQSSTHKILICHGNGCRAVHNHGRLAQFAAGVRRHRPSQPQRPPETEPKQLSQKSATTHLPPPSPPLSTQTNKVRLKANIALHSREREGRGRKYCLGLVEKIKFGISWRGKGGHQSRVAHTKSSSVTAMAAAPSTTTAALPSSPPEWLRDATSEQFSGLLPKKSLHVACECRKRGWLVVWHEKETTHPSQLLSWHPQVEVARRLHASKDSHMRFLPLKREYLSKMMTGAGWSLWSPSKSGFFLLVVCTWQGNRGYLLQGPMKMNNPAMQPLLWSLIASTLDW